MSIYDQLAILQKQLEALEAVYKTIQEQNKNSIEISRGKVSKAQLQELQKTYRKVEKLLAQNISKQKKPVAKLWTQVARKN